MESATKEMACDLAFGQQGTHQFMQGGSNFQEHMVKLKVYEEQVIVFGDHLPVPPSVLEALQWNANPS